MQRPAAELRSRLLLHEPGLHSLPRLRFARRLILFGSVFTASAITTPLSPLNTRLIRTIVTKSERNPYPIGLPREIRPPYSAVTPSRGAPRSKSFCA